MAAHLPFSLGFNLQILPFVTWGQGISVTLLPVNCMDGFITVPDAIFVPLVRSCQTASYPSTAACKFQIVYLHLIWFLTQSHS